MVYSINKWDFAFTRFQKLSEVRVFLLSFPLKERLQFNGYHVIELHNVPYYKVRVRQIVVHPRSGQLKLARPDYSKKN